MRVGANARQFARIKRLHKEGMLPSIIAKTIQMTDQSLEKILAHLEGRPEVVLAVEENAEVQNLRVQNAELAAKLARFEEPTDGSQSETETVEDEETIEAGKEVEGQETIET